MIKRIDVIDTVRNSLNRVVCMALTADFDIMIEKNEDFEFVEKHELTVEIEENWFISFTHSEYHQHDKSTSALGHNVGLPLQRSASLNYSNQRARPPPPTNFNNISFNRNDGSKVSTATTTPPTTPTSSTIGANHTISTTTTTDFDNQIDQVESEYGDHIGNNRNYLESPHSFNGNIASEAVTGIPPNVNSAVESVAAAVGRMLQIENASSSKSATIK